MTAQSLSSTTALILCLLARTDLYAGGPAYVAGSAFDPSAKGTPLIWAQGKVEYYTDQGDLSPVLAGAATDAFVADAFSRWTSVPTAAISATRVDHLAEDVNGNNVFTNADGSTSMPADILPSATKPLAVVYDSGGQVTDALLGLGAGGVDSCFTNAVFGGPDNFSSDGHITHALVVLNGNCAASASQVPDVKYRLVRVLGRVLGLGWSQTVANPTSLDSGGFTIMHATDFISCVPISVCYPNADVPKMDDRAALSRLYPVTAQNLANLPGKQLFQDNTVRVHGSVWFADAGGAPSQPMQGVNVVARWIDPSTGQVSRTYIASSVSGFLFRGSAPNPVTGNLDALGQPVDQFGSDDTSLEGYFDLAGLEIPDGSSTARYQLSTEPLDPLLSWSVGPYAPSQVLPSGSAPAVTLAVTRGSDVRQDVVMHNLPEKPDWFGTQNLAHPASVPPTGDWTGTLSGYGDTDYFRFAGQGNRSLSIEVTALDESATPSTNKTLPVIGLWTLADQNVPAPTAVRYAFNTSSIGMTRLNAALRSSTDFRIGISDARGDGRPDFRYRARVFYGDHVVPLRASAAGGNTLSVYGLGFRSNTIASVDGANAPVLNITPGRLFTTVPPLRDGLHSVTLTDPVTGASSLMTNVVTFGAGPNDTIKLLAGANPNTARGGEAPNPIRVQVLDPSGVTPVNGASVFLTASPAAAFSVCGGSTSCSVFSDESGEISTRVTALSDGASTITAQLAPASYLAPKQVQTTLAASTAALDLALSSPTIWIAQGATLDVLLSAKVLANAVGSGGKVVNFKVTGGTASLSAASVTSDANGIVNTTVHLSAMSAEVDLSVCIGPQNSPCRVFHLFAVPSASLRIEPVAASSQAAHSGQALQPVALRVVESGGNPVRGATIGFQWVVIRPPADDSGISIGDTNIGRNPMPVVLASLQGSVNSGADGIAAMRPTTGGFTGTLVIQGTASAGTASLPFEARWVGP